MKSFGALGAYHTRKVLLGFLLLTGLNVLKQRYLLSWCSPTSDLMHNLHNFAEFSAIKVFLSTESGAK